MTSQTVLPSAGGRLRVAYDLLSPPPSTEVPTTDPGRGRIPAVPHPSHLYRVSRQVGVAAVGLLLLAAALAPSAVAGAAVAIAVACAMLGLPHGAVDHVVSGWLAGRRLSRGSLTAALAGYLAVVAAGAAALRMAPTITLVVFLAVAGWHFGR